MKTEFDLVWSGGNIVPDVKAKIIGKVKNEEKPYLSINPYAQSEPIFIQDKDLERFAVNILKALRSKHLK